MLPILKERLFNQITQTTSANIYVLLDPGAPVFTENPLHPGNLEVREGSPSLTKIKRPGYAQGSTAHPLLLTLRLSTDNGYPDELLLFETFECARSRRLSINGSYVCGWLVSEQSAPVLAKELSDSMLIWDASQQKKRVLPWFEPDRLALWMASPYSARLSSRMRSVTFWNLLDAQGDILTLERERLPAAPVQGGYPAEFWHLQKLIGLVRKVISASMCARVTLPPHAELIIANVLLKAREMGLSRTEDLVVFSLNCLTFGSNWYLSPDIQSRIADALSGKSSLVDALDSLPMDVWAVLSVSNKAENGLMPS